MIVRNSGRGRKLLLLVLVLLVSRSRSRSFHFLRASTLAPSIAHILSSVSYPTISYPIISLPLCHSSFFILHSISYHSRVPSANYFVPIRYSLRSIRSHPLTTSYSLSIFVLPSTNKHSSCSLTFYVLPSAPHFVLTYVRTHSTRHSSRLSFLFRPCDDIPTFSYVYHDY